ncbi:MAG: lysylphosphatidylglycerol synthase transmembrane domain-containing protein [Candidatus Methylacidiphilales bacterium]|nr:lysylphosphatidylglycerol synthase transmembrane domain-containing protein [Candidatus Methylacidiphilales bacterium]
MEFIRKYLGLTIRIVVSVVILAWLARHIDWAQMRTIAGQINPVWLGAAFLFVLPTILFTAWRWQVLARVQDIRLTLRQAIELGMVGQFFNSFLLGSSGGDVVKIYYATQAAPSRRAAAALSVVIDRILGLLALLIIAIVLAILHLEVLTSTNQSKYAVWTMFLVAAGAVGAVVFSLAGKPIQRWFEKRNLWTKIPLHGLLEKLLHAYDRFARSGPVIGWALMISIVSHVFGLTGCYCVIRSLQIEPNLWQFLATLPTMLILAAIPISISGFGVREGLAVVFLGLLGISKEHAVAFGLLSYITALGWSLVGGIVYLRYSAPLPEEAAEQIEKVEGQIEKQM